MKKMLAFFSWVPGKVATGRKGGYKTRIYPAWHPTLPTNPGFAPLGALPFPQTQHLSRLAAAYEPSVYPAWQLPTSPVFIPLDDKPCIYLACRQVQRLSRLTTNPAFTSLAGKSSVCPAWRGSQVLSRLAASPAFVSLGGNPSVYLAWRLAADPVFALLGARPSPKIRFYLAWRLVCRTQPVGNDKG